MNNTTNIINNTSPLANSTTPTSNATGMANETSPITSINTTGTSKPSNTTDYQSLPYNNATEFGILFGTIPLGNETMQSSAASSLAFNNGSLPCNATEAEFTNLQCPPPTPSEEGYMPLMNNDTEPIADNCQGLSEEECNPSIPVQEPCDENTPPGVTCIDEGDMPPNEETGAEEEQDEQDTDDGLSDFALIDDETEQEEEFDNDVEPEEEEEESEESEAETSEDEGGE